MGILLRQDRPGGVRRSARDLVQIGAGVGVASAAQNVAGAEIVSGGGGTRPFRDETALGKVLWSEKRYWVWPLV